MKHAITFTLERWTGWDFWKAFMSEAWQARAVAKQLIRTCRTCRKWSFPLCPFRQPGAPPARERCGPYRTIDLRETVLLVGGTVGCYRVMDSDARVKPWPRDNLPMLGA